MHNFRELIIWNKAMDLASVVYQATLKFPSEEKFGLISQIKRSSVRYLLTLQRALEEILMENLDNFLVSQMVLVSNYKHKYYYLINLN